MLSQYWPASFEQVAIHNAKGATGRVAHHGYLCDPAQFTGDKIQEVTFLTTEHGFNVDGVLHGNHL